MNICKKCTLNDNVFSVSINDEGLCNYCQQRITDGSGIPYSEYEEKEKQLLEFCDKYKGLPYQVLLAYSGGKDSTYTLYLLREKYKLSVLAVTFDNGFLTDQCRHNIHEVTKNLNVDNVTIKYSFANLLKVFNLSGSKEIFPRKSLERASSICTACIGLIKASMYKEAILRNIPFISFGWTPGQIGIKGSLTKLDYKMILANQKQIEKPIIDNLGNEFKKYFIDSEWLETHKNNIPYMIYPLVFSNYKEDVIFNTISKIGWKRPNNTDKNSTNCLLNSYANYLHSNTYGFNPYTLEIANLVRNGHLNREEGLNKIDDLGYDSTIDYVKKIMEKC